jgi:predicted metal-dependent phosphoesterase TrpH
MQAIYVDLHIHTTASDGSDGPEEIIKKIRDNSITIASVTDHNTIANTRKFNDLAGANGIRAVNGVELSTRHKGHPLEVLFYGFDLRDHYTIEVINNIHISEIRKTEEIVASLHDQYANISLEEYRHFAFDVKNGGTRLSNYLKEKNLEIGIYRDFNWGKVFPDLEHLLRALVKRKGFTILAHPGFSLKELFPGKIIKYLDEIREMGIDGIECFQSCHDGETEEILVKWCKANAMLITAGSDYHGEWHTSNTLKRIELSKLDIDPVLEMQQSWI